MRRLWLLLLAAWVLLAIGVWQASAKFTPAGLSDNDYQIDGSGRYVVIGVLIYDKQTGETIPVYNALYGPALPTPSPRPSDTPAATASATPTSTPEGPTVTPEPAATPGATPWPSPTPETKCWGTVTGTRVNVRDAPWGNVLGQVVQGDTLALEGVRFGSDGSRWYQIYWLPDVAGYIIDTYVSSDPDTACDHLIDRPMLGWTVTPGASRDALLAAGEILKAGGITPSATVTNDGETASVLHDAGWFVVVRMWAVWPGDCPDMSLPPATSARLRVEYLARQHGGARFSAAQLTNECAWPSAAYLRDWLIAAVGECDARGWVCLPTVFNTGAPELDWLITLRPALRLMRERGHYLGLNLGPYKEQMMLCDQDEWTSWTTYRYRRYSGYMPVDELPPIYVTEAARGNATLPPVIEDTACFVRVTRGELAGVNFWYYGVPLAPWAGAAWTNDQLWEAAGRWARVMAAPELVLSSASCTGNWPSRASEVLGGRPCRRVSLVAGRPADMLATPGLLALACKTDSAQSTCQPPCA